MTKMLTKHGNSYAVILDKPILDLLHITPETPLNVTTDGKNIVIGPSDAARVAQFDAIRKEIVNEWSDTFKRLAE